MLLKEPSVPIKNTDVNESDLGQDQSLTSEKLGYWFPRVFSAETDKIFSIANGK